MVPDGGAPGVHAHLPPWPLRDGLLGGVTSGWLLGPSGKMTPRSRQAVQCLRSLRHNSFLESGHRTGTSGSFKHENSEGLGSWVLAAAGRATSGGGTLGGVLCMQTGVEFSSIKHLY